MWPFSHRHDWDLLDVRHGPWVEEASGFITCPCVWYWRCACGDFTVNLGGPEHVKITGRLPEAHRGGNGAAAVTWMRQFVPADQRDPGGGAD